MEKQENATEVLNSTMIDFYEESTTSDYGMKNVGKENLEEFRMRNLAELIAAMFGGKKK